MKSIFAAAACACFIAGTAAAVQIEGFNYANDAEAEAQWIVGGNWSASSNDGTKSVDVSASLTDKQEGSSALRIDYTYTSHWYYTAFFSKTYPAPLDLSAAKKFTVQAKCPNGFNDAQFFIFQLRDTNGNTLRFVSWDFPLTEGEVWSVLEMPLSIMLRNGWDPHTPYDNFSLKEVVQIEFGMSKSWESGEGTTYLLLDDLQYETSDSSGETVIEDFDRYTSNAQLKACWATFGPDGTIDVQTTTTAADGGLGMELMLTNLQPWVRAGAKFTFPSTRDFSNLGYIQLWAYGPATQTVKTPLYLYLEDSTGNRVRVIMSGFRNAGRWFCYTFPMDVASATPVPPATGDSDGFWGELQDYNYGNEAVATWHQDKYDPAMMTDINLQVIKAIWINAEVGETDSANLVVDRLAAGPAMPASAREWSLFE